MSIDSRDAYNNVAGSESVTGMNHSPLGPPTNVSVTLHATDPNGKTEHATLKMRIPSSEAAYDTVVQRLAKKFPPESVVTIHPHFETGGRRCSTSVLTKTGEHVVVEDDRGVREPRGGRRRFSDSTASIDEAYVRRQQILVDGGFNQGGTTIYQKIMSHTGDIVFVQEKAVALATGHRGDTKRSRRGKLVSAALVSRGGYGRRRYSIQSLSSVVHLDELENAGGGEGILWGRTKEGGRIPMKVTTYDDDVSSTSTEASASHRRYKRMRWVKRKKHARGASSSGPRYIYTQTHPPRRARERDERTYEKTLVIPGPPPREHGGYVPKEGEVVLVERDERSRGHKGVPRSRRDASRHGELRDEGGYVLVDGRRTSGRTTRQSTKTRHFQTLRSESDGRTTVPPSSGERLDHVRCVSRREASGRRRPKQPAEELFDHQGTGSIGEMTPSARKCRSCLKVYDRDSSSTGSGERRPSGRRAFPGAGRVAPPSSPIMRSRYDGTYEIRGDGTTRYLTPDGTYETRDGFTERQRRPDGTYEVRHLHADGTYEIRHLHPDGTYDIIADDPTEKHSRADGTYEIRHTREDGTYEVIADGTIAMDRHLRPDATGQRMRRASDGAILSLRPDGTYAAEGDLPPPSERRRRASSLKPAPVGTFEFGGDGTSRHHRPDGTYETIPDTSRHLRADGIYEIRRRRPDGTHEVLGDDTVRHQLPDGTVEVRRQRADGAYEIVGDGTAERQRRPDGTYEIRHVRPDGTYEVLAEAMTHRTRRVDGTYEIRHRRADGIYEVYPETIRGGHGLVIDPSVYSLSDDDDRPRSPERRSRRQSGKKSSDGTRSVRSHKAGEVYTAIPASIIGPDGNRVALASDAPLFIQQAAGRFVRVDDSFDRSKPTSGIQFYTLGSDNSFVEVLFSERRTRHHGDRLSPRHIRGSIAERRASAVDGEAAATMPTRSSPSQEGSSFGGRSSRGGSFREQPSSDGNRIACGGLSVPGRTHGRLSVVDGAASHRSAQQSARSRRSIMSARSDRRSLSPAPHGTTPWGQGSSVDSLPSPLRPMGSPHAEKGVITETYMDGQDRVTVMEIPQHHEIVREIPKKMTQVVEKFVPKYEVQHVDKYVEVPKIETVDRVEEYEELQEKITYVPKKFVVDVPREVVKCVPKVETRITEQVIEVPNVVEVTVPHVIEQQVPKPRYNDIEVPVVVAQIVQPVIVQDSSMPPDEHQCEEYIPDVIPVDVYVPKPVHANTQPAGVHTEHTAVNIPPGQWNALLDQLNPTISGNLELLPYIQDEQGGVLKTNSSQPGVPPNPNAVIHGFHGDVGKKSRRASSGRTRHLSMHGGGTAQITSRGVEFRDLPSSSISLRSQSLSRQQKWNGCCAPKIDEKDLPPLPPRKGSMWSSRSPSKRRHLSGGSRLSEFYVGPPPCHTACCDTRPRY